MIVFSTLGQLRDAQGQALGPGPWTRIDQQQVDLFADVTGDHQWIHVDRRRAASGPHGGTIVHGFLTLSLLPTLGEQLFVIEVPGVRLNYGLDRVRFPAAVPTGAGVRVRVDIVDLIAHTRGHLLRTRYTLEVAGQDRPGCVAENLTLLHADPP